MRHVRVVALASALGGLMIAASACASENHTEPPSSEPSFSNLPVSRDVVIGDGRDRTASRTVSDWVTYADHVLVVTVVDETRHEPSRIEIERGEGLIGRSVTLRVDEVLWSAPDSPQPAPATTLTLPAAGWVFNNNNGTGTVKFVLRNSSRLDDGHTYVKAIEWMDDPCSDEPDQGKWVGLGSGDSVPFDEGILGSGEFEGRVLTLNDATATWQANEFVPPSVRSQAVGKSTDQLVADLNATPPRREKGYGPGECNPLDR